MVIFYLVLDKIVLTITIRLNVSEIFQFHMSVLRVHYLRTLLKDAQIRESLVFKQHNVFGEAVTEMCLVSCLR